MTPALEASSPSRRVVPSIWPGPTVTRRPVFAWALCIAFTLLFVLTSSTLASDATAASGGPLSRVKYRMFGKEKLVTAEVIFETGSDGARTQEVILRTFSEQLGDYYSIRVAPESVLEVDAIPPQESKEIRAGWDEFKRERQAERARAAEERRIRAEKAAAEARRRSGGSAKESGEADRVPARVPIEPKDPRETLVELREEIRPLRSACDALLEWIGPEHAEATRLREQSGADGDARDQLLRYLMRLGSYKSRLQKVREDLESEQSDFELLSGDVESKTVRPSALRSRSSWILRRLEEIGEDLAEIETGLESDRDRLGTIRDALASAQAERESRRAAELAAGHSNDVDDPAGVSSTGARSSNERGTSPDRSGPASENVTYVADAKPATGAPAIEPEAPRDPSPVATPAPTVEVAAAPESGVSEWILLITGLLVASGGFFAFLASKRS